MAVNVLLGGVLSLLQVRGARWVRLPVVVCKRRTVRGKLHMPVGPTRHVPTVVSLTDTRVPVHQGARRVVAPKWRAVAL